MKIKYHQYKTDKSLSKFEMALLEATDEDILISTALIKRKIGWDKQRIKNIFATMKRKGILVLLKKDCYVVRTKIAEYREYLANQLTQPSYISFWSALSLYGYTEQQLNAVQVISIKQQQNRKIIDVSIEVTTVKPAMFFGYQKWKNMVIAEKEKAFIDGLYKPEKAGGINELKKCLKNAWHEIDQKNFLEYLKKMKLKSLFARAGYLLEDLQLENKNQKEFLKNIPQSYTRVNPQRKKGGVYIKKWRVMLNDNESAAE